MTTKKTVVNPEFLYLSLGDIIVEEQIRSSIDTESDSFKAPEPPPDKKNHPML